MAFVRMSTKLVAKRIADWIRDTLPGCRNGVLTVVIDGKAAAGKTHLADYLKKSLRQHGVHVCKIEADWFLASRREREEKERAGRREVSGHTYFPPTLHRSYWRWDKLKAAIAEATKAATVPADVTIRLPEVYDRRTGECNDEKIIQVVSAAPPAAANREGGAGQLTEVGEGSTGESVDEKVITVARPYVIIVAGCYLLAEDFAPDIAIMLYVNREIGRARKIQREERKKEGEFPNVERVGVVVTNWEQLEEPTFFWHLMNHGLKAHVVLDTSDTDSMSVVKFELPGGPEDEFQRAQRWDEQVKAAEENKDARVLFDLAKEAPTDADRIRVMLHAGQLWRGNLDFANALDAFSGVLDKAPKSLDAMAQKALMLERLGRTDEARTVLEGALAASNKQAATVLPEQAELAGILGRITKQLWKARWFSSLTNVAKNRQAALAQKALLEEALSIYVSMFRKDPTSFYNGDNATALACLYEHLAGAAPPLGGDGGEPQRRLEDIRSATRMAAEAFLLRKPDDFWAHTTLGNLALTENRRQKAEENYTQALQKCDPEPFAVDSVKQQLQMFQALGYRPELCAAALAILNTYRNP